MLVYAIGFQNQNNVEAALRDVASGNFVPWHTDRLSMPAAPGGAIPGPLFRFTHGVYLLLEGWGRAEARAFARGWRAGEPLELEIDDELIKAAKQAAPLSLRKPTS